MTAPTAKAKCIDRYIADSPKNLKTKVGSTDVKSIELWPEADDKNIKTPQKEEDLYGYGDGVPTPRNTANSRKAPRRSSLKGSECSGGKQRRASIGYTGEMTLVLPTGETKKKRTSISFAEHSDVKEVQAVADMVDNPQTLWFQANEYEHILRKINDLVEEEKSRPKGSKDRPSWICTRGLENVIDDTHLDERAEATATVLDENRVQKIRKSYDAVHIRNMYLFHTGESQHRAQEMAKKDQKDVEEYLSITRRMCRRMSC